MGLEVPHEVTGVVELSGPDANGASAISIDEGRKTYELEVESHPLCLLGLSVLASYHLLDARLPVPVRWAGRCQRRDQQPSLLLQAELLNAMAVPMEHPLLSSRKDSVEPVQCDGLTRGPACFVPGHLKRGRNGFGEFSLC